MEEKEVKKLVADETKFVEFKGVKYYPIIGLEVHAEMKTKTKMWCGCLNDPENEQPNVNICPVCMAHPGTLPVPNEQAIQNVIKVGLSVGSNIANFTEFDRKNYFYPDIPKGYQISQYKYPIVSRGHLAGVELTRIHLEEDTATSTHDKDNSTLINFNRAGVPLMELVTEACIHDTDKIVSFAKELQLLLKYLKVSDADMEKGHMRIEVNVSVTPDPYKRSKSYVEVKNINSFSAAKSAAEYEIKRMIELWSEGKEGEIIKETRGWDENSKSTKSQRSKENAEDYRYFPDPDISKLYLHEYEKFNPENLKQTLPELPGERRDRYLNAGLKGETTETFVTQPVFGDYFDLATAEVTDNALLLLISNYISSDLAGMLKTKGEIVEEEVKKRLPNPIFIEEMCEMILGDMLGSRGAKDLLVILVKNKEGGTEEHPTKIAEEKNMLQISDAGELEKYITEVLADAKNEKSIAEYKAGKEPALMALMGQIIKTTGGRANPNITKNILIEKLK